VGGAAALWAVACAELAELRYRTAEHDVRVAGGVSSKGATPVPPGARDAVELAPALLATFLASRPGYALELQGACAGGGVVARPDRFRIEEGDGEGAALAPEAGTPAEWTVPARGALAVFFPAPPGRAWTGRDRVTLVWSYTVRGEPVEVRSRFDRGEGDDLRYPEQRYIERLSPDPQEGPR
jgi:hypothetical protein